MGKWPWQRTTRGLDYSTKLWMEKNPLSGYRDMGSASLVAARPAARPPGPWHQYPSSPEGWGVKRASNSKNVSMSWDETSFMNRDQLNRYWDYGINNSLQTHYTLQNGRVYILIHVLTSTAVKTSVHVCRINYMLDETMHTCMKTFTQAALYIHLSKPINNWKRTGAHPTLQLSMP